MKLLLAEDERSLSRAVSTILRKNNYTVDAVYDGISAYDSLSGGSYDGAILDIMMPGMDGLTVLRRIRAQGNRVPVILLTAKSEIDDKVEGLDAGANDYEKSLRITAAFPAPRKDPGVHAGNPQ